MSHKMNLLFYNLVLVTFAFVAAIGFHSLETRQIPGQIIVDEMVATSDGEHRIAQDTIRLIGLGNRVRIDQPDEIDQLWQKFLEENDLHKKLDWTRGQTVFALYQNFDSGIQYADLFLGYPDNQTSDDTGFTEATLPAGKYRLLQPEGTESKAVSKAWEQILKDGSPSLVIERYSLDSLGNTRQVKIQVRENH
ncbi:MAG: effector binding domain-containing protein [Pseudomonadota bacterium]